MPQVKSNIHIEQGTPSHAFELAFNMRTQDMIECALGGKTPLEALITPFRYQRSGVKTYTILDNNKVVAMFGAVSTANNLKHASVWLLGSKNIEQYSTWILKRTKKWVDYVSSDYDFVFNLIPEENQVTIKWLKWIGFEFSNKEILVKGVRVLYFSRKIHGVSNDIQPVLADIGPLWITDLN